MWKEEKEEKESSKQKIASRKWFNEAPESHEQLLKLVLEERILKKKDGKKKKKVLLKESTKTIFHTKEDVAGAKNMEFTENRILEKETESTVIGVQD